VENDKKYGRIKWSGVSCEKQDVSEWAFPSLFSYHVVSVQARRASRERETSLTCKTVLSPLLSRRAFVLIVFTVLLGFFLTVGSIMMLYGVGSIPLPSVLSAGAAPAGKN
jgi:uncharacterized membrane protein YeiB